MEEISLKAAEKRFFRVDGHQSINSQKVQPPCV